MIRRALILSASLTAGIAASQWPEFTQQYLQRLGGTVDALGVVVADFDATAAASGLSREHALSQMTGTAFLERRQSDMARTIARFERLSVDLARLEAAPALRRTMLLRSYRDGETFRAAASVFRPAVPVTFDGGVFGLLGFLAGGAVGRGLVALLRARRARSRA